MTDVSAPTATLFPPPDKAWRVVVGHIGLLLLLLMASSFILHSVSLGWKFLVGAAPPEARLFNADAPLANAAIGLHMAGGGVITALAPLQLAGVIRRRAPGLHRLFGRLLALLALVTAAGGLGYIGIAGTIGGPPMDWAFALYGLCLAVAAGATWHHARARQWQAHRDWALRLAILSLGSFFYRVHYTVWWMTTDGLWSNRDFTGAFDRIQLLAFFVPYLIAVELWLRFRRKRQGIYQVQPAS